MPLIFELYARKRLGSHAITNSLNEMGHRTASGRPWSYRSVITVLRNRTYLGRIYFRGRYHVAAHPQLVDEPTLDAAQALLLERGEDVG